MEISSYHIFGSLALNHGQIVIFEVHCIVGRCHGKEFRHNVALYTIHRHIHSAATCRIGNGGCNVGTEPIRNAHTVRATPYGDNPLCIAEIAAGDGDRIAVSAAAGRQTGDNRNWADANRGCGC